MQPNYSDIGPIPQANGRDGVYLPQEVQYGRVPAVYRSSGQVTRRTGVAEGGGMERMLSKLLQGLAALLPQVASSEPLADMYHSTSRACRVGRKRTAASSRLNI